MVAGPDFVVEPGPGGRPIVPGRARGDVQPTGGVLAGQAGEISQFYQLRLDRVLPRELIKRLVDRQKLVVGVRRGDVNLLYVHPRLAAAVTQGAFAAGPAHTYAAPSP